MSKLDTMPRYHIIDGVAAPGEPQIWLVRNFDTFGAIRYDARKAARPYVAWRHEHNLGCFKTKEAAAKEIYECERAAGHCQPMSAAALRAWRQKQRAARKAA